MNEKCKKCKAVYDVVIHEYGQSNAEQLSGYCPVCGFSFDYDE